MIFVGGSTIVQAINWLAAVVDIRATVGVTSRAAPRPLNMSSPSDQRRSSALPVDHVAWRLQRGTHSVEARLRQHPLGLELWCI